MQKTAWDLEAGDVTDHGTVMTVYRYTEFVDVRFDDNGNIWRDTFLRDDVLTVY